jgi:hypothetical protein
MTVLTERLAQRDHKAQKVTQVLLDQQAQKAVQDLKGL